MLLDVTGTLVIDGRTREWCRLPYPGHPHGCPNYGRSEECPPKVPVASDVFDLTCPHWLAVVAFDLGAHARIMAKAHPAWSIRRTRSCLYWQNGVRRRLKSLCDTLIEQHPGYAYTLIPEAMGVNVFRTAHRHGLGMRKNPLDVVYKVALIGKELRACATNPISDIRSTRSCGRTDYTHRFLRTRG